MEPWKKISLLPPPVQTNALEKDVDIEGLRHTCVNIIRVLTKQSPLHKEGAILSRIVYKYDKKFRNDIGYRNIKKTNSTLRKYLQLNLLKDIENFTAVLPNEDEDFIPTRQMLEYILSRIITFSRLMVRIYVSCKQAAVFYLDRIKRGESHWMSLLPYAVLSRIWSICAVLLQHATSWYSGLYSYITVLQPKGLYFLPVDYELPNDLAEFLKLNNIDTFGKLDWTLKKLELTSPDDDLDKYDNILYYVSYDAVNEDNMETELENLRVNLAPNDHHLHITNVSKTDHGQAISRESYKQMNSSIKQENMNSKTIPMQDVRKTNQNQTFTERSCEILAKFQKKIRNDNKHSHYFGRVTNAKSLKDFLDREEELRNDGNEQSLTSHLSFMQWHTLKNSLQKICESVLNNRRIEKKLQKVWKEKCLDYNV